MSKLTCFLVAGVSAAAVAGPTVTVDENWSQDAASSQVTVKYKLSGEPAIITLDVLTNGVSIGSENISRVVGDANCVVQPSTDERTILWRPDCSWKGHVFTKGEISVSVVAWPLDNPPDYMAVNLSKPSLVSYYVSAGAVPFGVTNRRYKGEWLLMRRIHAAGKEFVMGTCPSENSYEGTFSKCDAYTPLHETAHPVAFTKDFYIGVYELTRMQGYLGCNNAFSGPWYVTLSGVSWNAARGADTWPGSDPAETSFLGILRTRTGIAFDLPTEAQWEYACRAGTTSGINNGREVGDLYAYDGNQPMCEVGWTPAKTGWSSNGHEVGLLQPNAWGLYDMHGNMSEWCLDWVSAEGLADYAIDPIGLSGGSLKALRGGCAAFWPVQARSGARLGFTPGSATMTNFRVVCPIKVLK